MGYTPTGFQSSPVAWIVVVATACLAQLLVGVLMDRRYDERLLRTFPVAILYPVVYWALLSFITAIYSLQTLSFRREQSYTWSVERG